MVSPNRKRHTELDWHRQSSLSRFNNGALPMPRHMSHYEATRKRLNQKRKSRFDHQDGMFCVLIVVAVLVSLDAMFGGLYR